VTAHNEFNRVTGVRLTAEELDHRRAIARGAHEWRLPGETLEAAQRRVAAAVEQSKGGWA
jgi:hypothetical protein